MTEEPGGGTVPADTPEGEAPVVRSTELVLPPRRLPAVVPRRWAGLAAELRRRLPELRRHPAAFASASAAATIGSALLVNGLRQALRHAEVARPGSTGATVVGYIVHEVHVIHHLVHEVRPSPLPPA